jgi:hypothetical protein
VGPWFFGEEPYHYECVTADDFFAGDCVVCVKTRNASVGMIVTKRGAAQQNVIRSDIEKMLADIKGTCERCRRIIDGQATVWSAPMTCRDTTLRT